MNHTGDHSPSQVSNRLRSVGHVASGSRPRPCIVDPELPLEPSFRGVLPRFRGNEGRSVPLPTDAECSQFGTVSDRAYRQAVTRLSWLSYSPSGFSPERRPRHGPVSAVAGRELPTPARLDEPYETFTRVAARRLWSEPPGRDLHPLGRLRPRLAPRCFPVAPLPRNLSQHRIEHRDYSRRSFSLTRGAWWARIEPMSLRRTGRATLMASGSTGQHHCGWLTPLQISEDIRPDLKEFRI